MSETYIADYKTFFHVVFLIISYNTIIATFEDDTSMLAIDDKTVQ